MLHLSSATKWHGKWEKKSHDMDWKGWKGREWEKPCSDGWWERIKEKKQVNDDNRQVLRCLLHNCGYQVKQCAHDDTCRLTTRCLRDCVDDRTCAFECLKKYDGINNDNVKELGQCALENECMAN